MKNLPEIIMLCGFSGAGKSTVGKVLAQKLDYPYTDTDEVVEETMGKSIADIFIQMGEARFRFAESDALRVAVEHKPNVISLGGGAVEDEHNLEYIKDKGKLVYLKVGTDTVYDRIKDGPFRPMLDSLADQEGDLKEVVMSRIEKLLDRREKYYLQADVAIDTEGKSPDEVADEIISRLKDGAKTK